MPWERSATAGTPADDTVGSVVVATISEVLGGAAVDLVRSPAGAPPQAEATGPGTASASDDDAVGGRTTLQVRLTGSLAPLAVPVSAPLVAILEAFPAAGLDVLRRFAGAPPALSPSLRRALRDTVVVEALSRLAVGPSGEAAAPAALVAEIVEFLVELSGTRVEAHDLTHGVLVTDALGDTPRLRVGYPEDLRAVKRAPLLFDGQRSVLVVDRHGRARTELQRHQLGRLVPGAAPLDATAVEFTESGSLVAEATRRLGGIGFFLRADRTIWAFVGGQPVVLRRAERWTAFPLELATAIGGRSAAAAVVVQAALIVSAQRHGAILAIAEDAESIAAVVPAKDRYDLRDELDPTAMQPETRLHHLIDATALDALTLARLAALDGATIVDRNAKLLAYAAIVTSADSQHEGARTAAAKSLSTRAAIVLKVSVDGDITVFRQGRVVATLLG